MKGRHIIIPQELKQHLLDQLHLNHMGIKKMKLLMHKSVYWDNVNYNIENHIKIVTCALSFSRHSPRRR